MERTVTIHLSNTQLSVNGNFRQVTSLLHDDGRFILCFKGILVNLMHINTFLDNTLLLSNEESLPVSRRKKLELETAYFQYAIDTLREDIK